jgi:hypothetical protein
MELERAWVLLLLWQALLLSRYCSAFRRSEILLLDGSSLKE